MELSNALFAERKPLYTFYFDDNAPRGIYIHHEWLAYLYEHHGMARRWALWEWLQYMQGCNPAVPNVAAKLLPETERKPLDKPRSIFATVLNEAPAGSNLTRCIYTRQPLDTDDFALDHFIPWSFVTHNQMWNLVPAPPAVNQEKLIQIPKLKYVERLSQFHSEFVEHARRLVSEDDWERYIKIPYVADLRLPSAEALQDPQELQQGYRRTVRPLLELAKSNGFPGDWSAA